MKCVLCALLIIFPLLAQNQALDAPALAGQIRALNEAIDANPADTRDLAAQREQLLYDLIAASPRDAVALAKTPAATPSAWTGAIDVIIADNLARKSSRTSAVLRTSDFTAELYFPAGAPKTSLSSAIVEGVHVRDRIAVSSLTPRNAGPMSCSVTGSQKTAVIMLTTPEDPSFPEGFTPSYVNKVIFGGAKTFSGSSTLSNYIQEASYGQTSIAGSVFGPYTLTQKPAYCDSMDYFKGAVAAAAKDASLDQYSRYVMLFPTANCTTSDGFEASGLGLIGCSLLTAPPVGQFMGSVAWIPVFPEYAAQNNNPYIFDVLPHEYGHNLGLQHANLEDYPGEPLGPLGVAADREEYGDVFDAMGAGFSGQYSAAHKSLDLGWIRPSEFLNVTQSGTFNILPLESSTGLRGLRIRRDAETNSWLWVEYRQPLGEADSQFGPATELIFNGASIRHEAPDADSDFSRSNAYLLDLKPSTSNLHDSALAVGKTWTDPYSPLHLTVNSADGKQLSLTVAYDQQCSSVAPLPSPLPSAGYNGILQITASPDCPWTAKSQAPWITLTGATTGLGNGTVSFTVANSADTEQRLGGITVNRQTVRAVQAPGNRTAVAGMTPFQGSGTDGTFTFRFTHAGGSHRVEYASIDFAQGNRSVCTFFLYQGAAYLIDHYDVVDVLNLSSVGSLASTSGCTLGAITSSYTTTATEAIYALRITFKQPGTHRAWAQVGPIDDVLFSTHIPLGSWVVPDCDATAGTTTFTIPGVGSSGTAQVSAPASCRWTAVGNAPWLFTDSGSLGNGALQFTAGPNPSAKERSGTIQLSNQTLRVTQAGAAPVFSLAPTTRTVPSDAASGQVALTATDDAPWTIVSSDPWLTVTNASGVGSATISYKVDANLAAGSRSATLTIGTASFRITQLGADAPAISSVNTVWGGSDISRNAWMEIKGKNLVPASTPAAGVIWNNAPEFANNVMPTSLAGIQVTINGKPAYIYFFCSAATSTVCKQDQINVLTPATDASIGPVDVIVINNGTPAPAFTATKRAVSPTLLQFDPDGHVTSIHSDGSLLGPISLYPGLSTPAHPNEIVTVFGVGFGIGSSGAITEGASTQSASLTPFSCTIGGQPVAVRFAGIVSPGLAQINLGVPILAAGEHTVSCSYSGNSTGSAAKLAVEP